MITVPYFHAYLIFTYTLSIFIYTMLYSVEPISEIKLNSQRNNNEYHSDLVNYITKFKFCVKF